MRLVETRQVVLGPAVVGFGKIIISVKWILLFSFWIVVLSSSTSGFGQKILYRTKLRSTQGTRMAVGMVNSVNPDLSLLSFDLDDTLFPMECVVEAANVVMLDAMKEFGCFDSVTIDMVLTNVKRIRKELPKREPMKYGDLRKRAIEMTMKENTLPSVTVMDDVVEVCYQAWVNERHRAAERYLYPDAMETLQHLRDLYPNALFAAITNGAGNPMMMTGTLAPFFDFRVSGEDDEVFPHRKPHPYIYQYAVKLHNEELQRRQWNAGIWCHVGDCLANDISASFDCGAKAIWIRSLDDNPESVESSQIPKWSTASAEEIDQRALIADAGRLKMAATIRSLSELPVAISNILLSSNSNI
jgi:FMN phosphatase YigB (HAD superfamily)